MLHLHRHTTVPSRRMVTLLQLYRVSATLQSSSSSLDSARYNQAFQHSCFTVVWFEVNVRPAYSYMFLILAAIQRFQDGSEHHFVQWFVFHAHKNYAIVSHTNSSSGVPIQHHWHFRTKSRVMSTVQAHSGKGSSYFHIHIYSLWYDMLFYIIGS